MSFTTSALILSWLAIGVLALVVSGLVRQVHALSSGAVRRPEPVGLPVGTPAPGYAQLAPATPATLVLLFLDQGCGTCAEVLAAATRIDRPGIALRVFYRDDPPAYAMDSPLRVLTGQAALFERYDVVVTPFAVVVDMVGRVLRSEPLGARSGLDRLIDQITMPSQVTYGIGPVGTTGSRR